MSTRNLLVIASILLLVANARAEKPLKNGEFLLEYGPRGITSLKRVNDVHDTEYISSGGVLGNVAIQYKSVGAADWSVASDVVLDADPSTESNAIRYVIGNPSPTLAENSSDSGPQTSSNLAASKLAASQTFTLDENRLTWSLSLANQSDQSLEIGDLALPLNMSEGTPEARGRIYTQKLIRHSFVAGHGSWIYWQRANAVGPFLLMVPQGKTKIEYAGPFVPASESKGAEPSGSRRSSQAARRMRSFTPFVHAAVSSDGPIAQGKAAGREQPWRLPLSSLTLAPKGTEGDSVTYSFNFVWAKDFDDVREAIYDQGSIDVNIVPGMTVPTDLDALIALRTKEDINGISAEFPDSTKIDFVADKGNGYKIYRASFKKLGENMLTIHFGDDRWSTLEFFVTEPLETVIKKRSDFLVTRHQHKDPSKWWYGVYSDWDQINKVLRGPGNRDGLSPWLVEASDDAGNARPAYIASKNLFFPDQSEVDSVELYIKHYLFAGNDWKTGVGGMQMTEEEPYPYGIYGTFDNWHQHRTIDPNPPADFVPQDQSLPLDVGWKRLHREHLWRIYDYPHIMLMYYRMYQIAKAYPGMTKFANADEYLMLAYNTSVAYWTVPMQTDKPYGWSANSVPTMNEAFLPELILALEREGQKAEANKLHELWNSKVKEFVNPKTRPNLFGSEFSFDSTGFESTASMAKYAMQRVTVPGMADGVAPEYTAEQVREFTEFQLRLNMGDRGWLENTYYQLGSDYRGDLTYLLSYMSQMGGWGILDYGLHVAKDPAPHLRLGYASTLSSWALVNSGTEESGYGYWWPGKENDGACGGGFMPDPYGAGWIRKSFPRGAWNYSAEQDVGFTGVLRSHATIVTDDPLFGEFAYGGDLSRSADRVNVVPKDGLRARLHVVRGTQRLHMELMGAQFATQSPIVLDDSLTQISFTLDNRPGSGLREIAIAGLPPGNYTLSVNGTESTFLVEPSTNSQSIPLSIGDAEAPKVVIQKVP